MKLLFLCLFSTLVVAQSVSIKDTTYLDRAHYCITTPSATYLFDRAGGGLSGMLDREGRDWISFAVDSTVASYPRSAGGQYRGMPNAVFGNADGGVGHPGFDKAVSEKTSANTISTRSLSGKWAWTWMFLPDRAVWTVTQTDPDYAYWFLYEGTIGGNWTPVADKYWGTDRLMNGPVTDFYAQKSIFDTWQWAYFGDRSQNRVLFVAQQQPDDQPDTVGFLGNTTDGLTAPDGMVVFGFGRNKQGKPTMTRPNAFVIGFHERAVTTPDAYRALSKKIGKLSVR